MKKQITFSQIRKWREKIINGKSKYYPKKLIPKVVEMFKNKPVKIIK